MDGVLLADKPPGASSHDVVAAVRRVLGGARTGHAGTLDPLASGLLLILVGRATRVQRFFVGLPKTYRTIARLGALSSTGDAEGEVRRTGRMPPSDPDLPTGEVRQRPPSFSALKVGGERAYRRARRGEAFELPERVVTVYRFTQLWREADRAEFEIECSAGTYVRSLIADLDDAYCESLRRTAIGPFDVADAEAAPWARRGQGHGAPSPQALAESLLPLDRALSFLPRVGLEMANARSATHGQAVPAPPELDDPGQAVLLCDELGAVAIARPRVGAEGLELKPVVGLRAEH